MLIWVDINTFFSFLEYLGLLGVSCGLELLKTGLSCNYRTVRPRIKKTKRIESKK